MAAVAEKKEENKWLECYGCSDRVERATVPAGTWLLCPQNDALCKDCAERFLAGVLSADENLGPMQQRVPGSYSINCAICRQGYKPLTTIESFLTPKLHKLYVEQVACFSLAEGETWASCPLCSVGYVVLGDATAQPPALFYCCDDECKKVTCALCKREVTQKTELNHTEGCWSVAQLYREIQTAIEKSQTRSCPNCNLAGMKDDNCTHITCACGTVWCYCCGLVEASCDRPAGTAFMGHQIDWKTNRKRCPLYLQELHSVDAAAFPEQPAEVLAAFHRQLILDALSKVLQKRGRANVEKLLKIIPAALQGFTLDQIASSRLHPFMQERLPAGKREECVVS